MGMSIQPRAEPRDALGKKQKIPTTLKAVEEKAEA
jgi:hypothetical protein